MSTEWDNASPVRPEHLEEEQDLLPPNSIEAEKGVLACILLESIASLTECGALDPHAFYDLKHRVLYESLLDMFHNGVPIDTVSVYQWLGDRNKLDKIGGLPFLASLPDSIPSAANLSYYLGIVKEKAWLRKWIQFGSDVASKAKSFVGDYEELHASIESDFLGLIKGASATSEKIRTSPQLVSAAQDRIEQIKANAGKLSGIPTGFIDIDIMTGGLQKSELCIIAARPSVGKTALAMNIADNVAVNCGIPVGVLSLEMTGEALTTRMMCARGKVQMQKVRDGTTSDYHIEQLATASLALSKAPFYVDDSSGVSLSYIRTTARRMKDRHGIELLIIDYIQLITSTRRNSREEEISDVSSGLKAIAKDLGIVVLALSQLNREPEKRKDGNKPKLADLRGSGSIEQDADLVCLMHRLDDMDYSNEQAFPTNLNIIKQRNGPTGDVPLVLLAPYTKFESMTKHNETTEQAEY